MKGFDNIGRSIFSPERGIVELPNGKSIWFGLYQSTRMEWQLRINIDMVCKPAYKESTCMAISKNGTFNVSSNFNHFQVQFWHLLLNFWNVQWKIWLRT